MNKVRRCDDRCHNAAGSRCKCWYGGFFYGTGSEANREKMEEATAFLSEHGGKPREAYLGQRRLEL